MYLCYLDESGAPEIGKDTPHFVFLGLAIPASTWRRKDREITPIKSKYGLGDAEVHAAWMARRYVEQEKIPNFLELDWVARRDAVKVERDKTLIKIAAVKGVEAVKNLRRTFRQTEQYTHLTRDERLECLKQLADLIGSWNDSRLFADGIDKTSFGTELPKYPPFEEAFSQVVSRFHEYLERRGSDRDHGLLVQDNNPTAAKRLTQLMLLSSKGHFVYSDPSNSGNPAVR
jgi:hypothetical protein